VTPPTLLAKQKEGNKRMHQFSTSEIGPYVADLSQQRDRIVAATDFLFQGF
jgi:translation elongation factor EF-4